MDCIQKRPPLGVSLFLAASFFAAAVASAPAPRSSASARLPAIQAHRSAPLQLADEITRRLRRLGISFIRTRLPHPYDPAGEIC